MRIKPSESKIHVYKKNVRPEEEAPACALKSRNYWNIGACVVTFGTFRNQIFDCCLPQIVEIRNSGHIHPHFYHIPYPETQIVQLSPRKVQSLHE